MKYFLVALVSGLIGVALGYAIWGSGMTTVEPSFRSEPIPTESERVSEGSETSEASDTELQGTVTVEASAMSEEQQALLRSFGIDPAGVTVTAEMIACAQTALGKERLDTIMSGTTPTLFESAKLLGCYQL